MTHPQKNASGNVKMPVGREICREAALFNNLLSIKSHIYLGSLCAEFYVTFEIYLPYFPEIDVTSDTYLWNCGDICHERNDVKLRQKCQYIFYTECRTIF